MSETKLDKARATIDEVDEQIAALFEKRFEAVRDVIDYKIENRLPIFDSSREEVIKEKNTARIQNPDIRPYYKVWYEDLLDLSKQYQKEIKEEK